MNRVTLAVVISALLVLSIGAVSAANIVVVGKVYSDNYQNVVSGADIAVSCGTATKFNSSVADGTYGIGFDTNNELEIGCTNTSSVSVSTSFDGKTASSKELDLSSISLGENSLFYVVSNLNLLGGNNQDISGISGGSSGGGSGGVVSAMIPVVNTPVENLSTKCGNGICEPDENASTCPVDCAAPVNDTQPTGLARITGAVIGALGRTGTWIVVLFIVGIIAASVAIRMRRK